MLCIFTFEDEMELRRFGGGNREEDTKAKQHECSSFCSQVYREASFL